MKIKKKEIKISQRFKGRHWYNNGKINVNVREKPEGDEWVEGRLPDKLKRRTYRNGDLQTTCDFHPGEGWIETKYKRLSYNWKWYNNGIINVRYKQSPGPEWKKGKI